VQKRKTAAAIADRYFLGKNDAPPVVAKAEIKAEPPAPKIQEIKIIAAEAKPAEIAVEKKTEEKIVEEKIVSKPYADPLAKVEAAAQQWEARKTQN